jgi:hypothetical protein
MGSDDEVANIWQDRWEAAKTNRRQQGKMRGQRN